VVGIMSSPAHFEERQAIRESWIQFQSLTDPKLNSLTIAEKKSIVIRFIIGDVLDSPATEAALQTESFDNRDIIRVPVVESYFNLTLKTGEFFKWADASFRYRWVMKCDDDSFVRVDLLLQELLQRSSSNLYMGKIWTGTPVDRRIDAHTPWRQHPSFAAGAGYVLSSDLVSFIIRNYDGLYKYPLEDVAVGSWIAALKMDVVDHPHFHSLPEGCDRDMLVQNPANVTVMKQTFFNAVKGIPCHAKPDPFDAVTKNVTDHVLLELGIPKTVEKSRDVMNLIDITETPMMGDDMAPEKDDEDTNDGMDSNMMNSNLPSSDVMQHMNTVSKDSVDLLAQSAMAADDRMNAAMIANENDL